MTHIDHGALLHERLSRRNATIGIVGLGYVGLPLAHGFVRAGFPVTGFDVDARKVAALDAGVSYLDHLDSRVFTDLAAAEQFAATTDMGRLGEPDVVIICVPTPLGTHQEPDLSYVVGVGKALAKVLRPGQLIVLESTTYPGTTRDELAPVLAECGLTLGSELFVAYSPEREDPGRAIDTVAIPKLVGGLDPVSGQLVTALYSEAFASVVPVSSAEIAEAAKLLENIFRAVNIGLVNEMKTVLGAMGIDIWEVITAASTKPFGFMPFLPGPGIGGHCIPIDPFYLTWKAREFGRTVSLIEVAGLVNAGMPAYVVEQIAAALNDNGQAVRDARILVVGLSYKPDVGDTRESPSFPLVDMLVRRGARVAYHDPHVPSVDLDHHPGFASPSADLSPESLGTYDAVVIATNHRAVDYELIARTARLVIDTRNAMAPYADQMVGRLVKA